MPKHLARHRAGPPTQAIRPYEGQVISTSQYHKALCPVRHWSKLDLFALSLTCAVAGMLGGLLFFIAVIGS